MSCIPYTLAGTHLLLGEEFAPLIIDFLVEIPTVTVVHDNVETAPILEGLLVGNNVGMLHLGQDLHLDGKIIVDSTIHANVNMLFIPGAYAILINFYYHNESYKYILVV